MKETAGNRWCSTCRFRPPVKKLPTTPPQLADVSTCTRSRYISCMKNKSDVVDLELSYREQ